MDPATTAEPDDRALVAAHLAGDPEAFGVLFARHRDRLWAVALRTTGDPEEAADALQDALVAAFRRLDSYRGDAAVTTWLHRIVVNACLDRLRRRKVRLADPLPDDLDPHEPGRAGARSPTPLPGLSGEPAGPADPADLAAAHDLHDRVLAAMTTLPPEQRAALVLVDMEGYSVEETATVLGCAPGTVKSRCARGRARLAPLLAPLLEAHPGPGPAGAAVGRPTTSGRPGGNPEAGPRVPPGSERGSRSAPHAGVPSTSTPVPGTPVPSAPGPGGPASGTSTTSTPAGGEEVTQ